MIKLHVPDITEREKKAVGEVLDSGWLVQGEKVEKFEQDLAHYLGVNHVVCVSSCTAAIHLALHMFKKTTEKTEIITPDFSYPSVGIAIKQAGFEPVFCDINDFYLASKSNIESWITKETYAILSNTMFGFPNNYEELQEICNKHNIKLFDDAAPGIGSRFRGKRVGSFADATFFSFHATKLLTTGEGGAIVTNNAELAEVFKVLRNHGRIRDCFVDFGFPYRMTDIQAAIGIEQLKTLEDRIELRRELAGVYENTLDTCIKTLPLSSRVYHWNVQRFVCSSEINNEHIIKELAKSGVESTFGTYSQSSQPIWNSFTPLNSRLACKHTFVLPLHLKMSVQDVKYVAETLNDVTTRF
jgi:dTDP-4-amino-4,6-dideoxygalactose transaminase